MARNQKLYQADRFMSKPDCALRRVRVIQPIVSDLVGPDDSPNNAV
ncbi:MAG: hypothetical protein LBH13_01840 [Cellulomonadaceae bacterium]|jgi:hypothetical protein|nr:hypothetical protein [Cellulomonadaceae bacterium]